MQKAGRSPARLSPRPVGQLLQQQQEMMSRAMMMIQMLQSSKMRHRQLLLFMNKIPPIMIEGKVFPFISIL